MDIYLLSGLGADERLFQHLDLREHNLIPIKWIAPAKNESIEDYAGKIATQIRSENSILIGVSFGGIMAVEIGKIIPVKKIILISSAAGFKELPLMYRLAGRLRLQRILSPALLKRSQGAMNRIMGASDPKMKKLLADMLRDTDKDFLYWALDKIVSWRNNTSLQNVYRIHGDRDRVLPLTKTDYLVKKGGHFMVADRADEVSNFIKKIID